MGSRRKARILAFQALFSWEVSHPQLGELIQFTWIDDERMEKYHDDTLMFARLIVTGALENLESIDNAIKKQLEHWDFNRLSKVDLAILRMSVYSMLFQPDIPDSVTIDEAVDIAKEFGSDDSYRFINGVLDGIRKSQKKQV